MHVRHYICETTWENDPTGQSVRNLVTRLNLIILEYEAKGLLSK